MLSDSDLHATSLTYGETVDVMPIRFEESAQLGSNQSGRTTDEDTTSRSILEHL